MRTHILAVLLSMITTPASAANFSGKWVFEVEERGRIQQSTLILNQVGTEVTGLLMNQARSSEPFPGDAEIHGGKVEGDKISFYVWTGRDQPVKAAYGGTISGENITFIVKGGPAGAGIGGRPRSESDGPQQVIARRAR